MCFEGMHHPGPGRLATHVLCNVSVFTLRYIRILSGDPTLLKVFNRPYAICTDPRNPVDPPGLRDFGGVFIVCYACAFDHFSVIIQ